MVFARSIFAGVATGFIHSGPMKRILVLGLATLALSGGAAGAIQPNDPVWAEQLGVRQIGLPQVWETTTGDPGVIKIATGRHGRQPDSRPRRRPLPGYDFVDNDFESEDTAQPRHPSGERDRSPREQRHRDGGPLLGLSGNAHSREFERVSFTRAGSRWGSGMPSTGAPGSSTSASAIPAAPMETRRPRCEYAIERGVIVVASAGNAGTEALQYPGAYPGVVAVGGDRQPGRSLLLVEPRFLGQPDARRAARWWKTRRPRPGRSAARPSRPRWSPPSRA